MGEQGGAVGEQGGSSRQELGEHLLRKLPLLTVMLRVYGPSI